MPLSYLPICSVWLSPYLVVLLSVCLSGSLSIGYLPFLCLLVRLSVHSTQLAHFAAEVIVCSKTVDYALRVVIVGVWGWPWQLRYM